MPALARGQATNCANPTLDLFTQVNGVLVDVAVLEFQVFDVSDAAKQLVPVQVYPATLGDRAPVAVAVLCPAVGAGKVSTGRFVATYTPPLTEPLGTHRVKWFFKLTLASPEQTFSEEFEVLAEATASGEAGYCFVADLRAEGVTVAQASDAMLLALIARASRFIDRVTRRWFEPRTRTYRLDGSGAVSLPLDQPIISLASVSVAASGGARAPETRIYNRHISQGLLAPDDRDNPRVEFSAGSWGGEVVGLTDRHRRTWRRGPQNVLVSGVFGYTDPDDSSTVGITPPLIRRAAVILTYRSIPTLASGASPGSGSGAPGAIKEERTRDQSVSYGASLAESASGRTPWTGNPEVDTILDFYRAPPVIRVP